MNIGKELQEFRDDALALAKKIEQAYQKILGNGKGRVNEKSQDIDSLRKKIEDFLKETERIQKKYK